jgi:hypothetical protein
VSALSQAEQASGPALEAQRHGVEEQLPEMPAPTGLPPTEAPEGTPELPSVPTTTPAELEGTKTGRDQPPMDTDVPEPPPMPPAPPTVLPGPDTEPSPEEQASQAARAQQALEGVAMDTEQIPTDAGPPPAVDLSGEADPTQMDAHRGAADVQVAQAKAAAAAGINADHGLGTIYPAPTDEVLSAMRPLAGAAPPAAAGAGPATPPPPELAAGIDQSLGPGFQQRLEAKRAEYDAGQQQFDADAAGARADADADIERLTAETAEQQRAQREQASSDVASYQEEWRRELDTAEQDYATKAGNAAKDQRGKIAEKQAEGEAKAADHYKEAERKAEAEKRKADKKAEAEKAKKREESDGFWGWVKSKAAALVDLLKDALNAIYDGLRAIVKGVFELAKKLAMAAIELARMAIVGLLKAFGEILKGLVSIVLVAFPETAKRINAKIDGAVQVAVDGVNWAADKLKKGVAAVLDFLASTIDKLLGLVQSLYNGILNVVGMLIRGELKELLEKLGNVVEAAKKAPGKFESAVYGELLGGDFDKPLSPMELAMAEEKPPQAADPAGGQAPTTAADAGPQPMPPWDESNVGVDEVVQGAELSPEARAELGELAPEEGEFLIGESASPNRSMAAVMAEATGGAPGVMGAEQTEVVNAEDGLTPRDRAAVRWKLMKQGIARWFEENKVAIIAGAVAAILAIAALIFFSGGTILAAVGPIMAALGPLFIGLTVATIAAHVEDFVKKAWDGDREGGAMSLAKALAAGAVELISLITFKAGGAALRGGRAVAKAGFKLARTATKAGVKFLARGVKFVIRQGKVLLSGIKNLATRQFKRLRGLGEALLERLRFRKFRIVVRGFTWAIEGFINPWFTIVKGKLEPSKRGATGAVELDELTAAQVKAAGTPGKGRIKAGDVAPYKQTTTRGKGIRGDELEGDHVPSFAALLAKRLRKGKALGKGEAARLRDEAVTVVLPKGTHARLSRTYKGRNTFKKIARDSGNLGAAFHADAEAILKGLAREKRLTKKWVGSYMKAYNTNVSRGIIRPNPETDKMLLEFLRQAT